MNAEDRRWIKGLKQGKERAFSEFFTRYRGKIYHLALKIMNDPMEAEEVVQEVMLTVFRRVDSFQGQSRLSTWVYRVTVNAALMRLRTRKREHSLRIEDSLLELEDSAGTNRVSGDWRRWESPAEQPEQELSRKELGEQILLAMAEMALRLNPENWYSIQSLAQIYLKLNKDDKALEVYGPGLAKKNWDKSSELARYSRFWTGQGKNLDSALEAAKRAVELAPDEAYNWDAVSQACLKLKKYDEALKAEEKAVALAVASAVETYKKRIEAIKKAQAEDKK